MRCLGYKLESVWNEEYYSFSRWGRGSSSLFLTYMIYIYIWYVQSLQISKQGKKRGPCVPISHMKAHSTWPKAAEEARLADLLRHASAADQGWGRFFPQKKNRFVNWIHLRVGTGTWHLFFLKMQNILEFCWILSIFISKKALVTTVFCLFYLKAYLAWSNISRWSRRFWKLFMNGLLAWWRKTESQYDGFRIAKHHAGYHFCAS